MSRYRRKKGVPIVGLAAGITVVAAGAFGAGYLHSSGFFFDPVADPFDTEYDRETRTHTGTRRTDYKQFDRANIQAVITELESYPDVERAIRTWDLGKELGVSDEIMTLANVQSNDISVFFNIYLNGRGFNAGTVNLSEETVFYGNLIAFDPSLRGVEPFIHEIAHNIHGENCAHSQLVDRLLRMDGRGIRNRSSHCDRRYA